MCKLANLLKVPEAVYRFLMFRINPEQHQKQKIMLVAVVFWASSSYVGGGNCFHHSASLVQMFGLNYIK